VCGHVAIAGDMRIAHHDISLFMSGLGIEFAAAVECSHRALPSPCFAAKPAGGAHLRISIIRA
jgi:hypothetical protein